VTPLTRNLTFVTPTLSVAVAVIVTVVLRVTLPPLIGFVKETAGFVVSIAGVGVGLGVDVGIGVGVGALVGVGVGVGVNVGVGVGLVGVGVNPTPTILPVQGQNLPTVSTQ
jgi:hypothetical protein